MTHDLEAATCELRQAMEKCFQQDPSGRTIYSIAVEEVFPFERRQSSHRDSPTAPTLPDSDDKFSWITKMIEDADLGGQNKAPIGDLEVASTRLEDSSTKSPGGGKAVGLTATIIKANSRRSKIKGPTTHTHHNTSARNRNARAISGHGHAKAKPQNIKDRLADALKKVDDIGDGVKFQ